METRSTSKINTEREGRLSTQDYSRLVGTIASARRIKRQHDAVHEPREATYLTSTSDKNFGFTMEISFIQSPLGSRIPSAICFPKEQSKDEAQPVGPMPVHIQEALILEDLLQVLHGIEGAFITCDSASPSDEHRHPYKTSFTAPPTLEPSLRDFVARVLPLGTFYTTILAFLDSRSRLEYGQINHALCAAIRDMLKDYHTLLIQLEHAFNHSPLFTLRKLWFYIHPTIHTLSLIYHLVRELEDAADDSSEDSHSDPSFPFDAEEEAHDGALFVKGGEVLAIIYERMQRLSGDPTAHAVYDKLLRAASAPYAAMIKAWTTRGELVDPYHEFFVKGNKSFSQVASSIYGMDDRWEEKYILRDGSMKYGLVNSQYTASVPRPRPATGRLPGGACIPSFLEEWKGKILLAGQYLHVVRECDGENSRISCYSDQEDLPMNGERFYKSVDVAYQHANRTLLHILLDEQQLVLVLRTLKRYFLLSQSTYLKHFLDLSHTELRKSARSGSIAKLQSLLDLALIADDADDSACTENLKMTMATTGLYEWLLKITNVGGLSKEARSDAGSATPEKERNEDKAKGKRRDDNKSLLVIDVLTLDYAVKFPLSIVVSRESILRYQLLFRFLLHLKHVEQSLSSMWIAHKTEAWRQLLPHYPELAQWRLRISLLRMRMLAFVQQILAFATSQIIEPNWQILETKLAGAMSVDQLLHSHADFLDTCLKGCMLTSAKLVEAHSRLMTACSTFSLYASAFSKHLVQGQIAGTMPEGDPNMTERWTFLSKFETHFDHWFKLYIDYVQLDAMRDNVSLIPLVARLHSMSMEKPTKA